MINLLTSASQFLSDTENFNSTTDKLLSSLFDGFIFYLAVRSVYKELHADHETGAADNK